MPKSFLVKTVKKKGPLDFYKNHYRHTIRGKHRDNDGIADAVNLKDTELTTDNKKKKVENSNKGEINLKELFLNSIPVAKPFGLYYMEKNQQKEMKKRNNNFLEQDKFLFKRSSTVKVKGPLPQSIFNCQLCCKVFPNAIALAQHKCSGIEHVEHKCPECGKVFSCPANLASHRRWHRPRSPSTNRPRKTGKPRAAVKMEKYRGEKNLAPPNTRNDRVRKKFAKKQLPNNFKEPRIIYRENLDLTSYSIHERNERKFRQMKEFFIRSARMGSESSEDDIDEEMSHLQQLNQITYKCAKCFEYFSSKLQYELHMRHHMTRKIIPCKFCGQEFFNLSQHAKHVLSHASIYEQNTIRRHVFQMQEQY